MSDPTLELRDGNGELLLANDNWKDQQQTAIEQIGIPPNDSSEAAILAELAPGADTPVVAGKDGASGTALIEVYNSLGVRPASSETRNPIDPRQYRARKLYHYPGCGALDISIEKAANNSSVELATTQPRK